MKKILVSAALFATPLIALAQPVIQKRALTDGYALLDLITQILRFAVPFLISLAIVWFLWSVFSFIFKGNKDEAGRTEAKSQLLYSIIALAVMVSVYGLINFVTQTVNVDNRGIDIPSIPVPEVRR